MRPFIAAVIALAVVGVIAALGLLVSSSLFGSQVATTGGNAVILGFALVALVAGTFTYRRLV